MKELEYASEMPLSDCLDHNESALRQAFANCADLIVRRLQIFGSIPCMVAYFDVLVDKKLWNAGFLEPLMRQDLFSTESPQPLQITEQLKSRLASIVQPQITSSMQDIVQCIVKGEVVLFVESSTEAYSFKIKDELQRSLEEPTTEVVIRGPQIGFIEKLDINVALIRQRIRTPRLKMERFSAGKLSQTDIAIVYIENIAQQSIVDEIKKRIASIDMDSVLESGYIEEMIRDHPFTPFPLLQSTQRPDTVAGSLIEGKVAVFIDGSPFAAHHVLVRVPIGRGLLYEFHLRYNASMAAISIRLLGHDAACSVHCDYDLPPGNDTDKPLAQPRGCARSCTFPSCRRGLGHGDYI
jgi:spore germination protein KA